MADRLAHPLHLVLAALVERQLDPRRAEEAPRRRGRPSSSSTPSASRAGVVVRRALDLHLVDLVDLVARVGEPCASAPSFVSRARRSCRRRGGRPARRGRRRRRARRRSGGPRVARGRHDAGGLVQQHVCELLLRDRLAVHLDAVVVRHERVELPRLAVHRTRPALISSSALRREATPARASHAFRRMLARIGGRCSSPGSTSSP